MAENQYLFDYKLFLNNQLQFPPTIVFPQFFYMSIYSILIHYINNCNVKKAILVVIDYYFKNVQYIVNILFPELKLVKPIRIKELIYEYFIKPKDDIFYLEHYLIDDASKKKYQESLLNFIIKKTF